jgi:type IV pilus assembly protein PilQ
MSASTTEPAGAEKSQPAKYDKQAWLNRIDFTSEEAGKSAIIIGTTRPVEYQMIKVDNKRLHLKLLDTNLPEYRKRALITTRFQSAVDRITPSYMSKSKDTVIDVELREGVPYFVKQTDDVIRVNFAASRIPPRPYEDAKLPAWKQVLAEPAAAPAKKSPEAAGKTTMATAAVKTTKKTVEPGEAEKATLSRKSLTEPDEVKYTEIEPERYDIERQRRTDFYSGEKSELDVYGEQIVKKYTGEPIVLDFYETDIKNVFRILKEISGKNFAIDKGVTGRVTLALEQPVPWDQVLDLILKMNQLGRKMEGDIIRIATLTTLAQEEILRQKKLKAAQKAKKQEDLITAFLRINYATAAEVNATHVVYLLTEGRGKSTVDGRLNMIVVTDVPSVIKRVKEVIQRLDQVTPQVVIEARIVEANSSFTRDLGFDWGTVSAGPFNNGGTELILNGLASNLPAAAPSGVVGFDFIKLSGTPFSIIDAKLVVSETEGKTNIISAPKIVTLDNKKARIKQGLEVPYQERDSSGNSTIRFKNVDLLLEVTPNVTPDNRINMKIFVTKNDVAEQTPDGPALSTNEAETELLIDDGDTIVIGGIVKSAITYGEKGIPGLRKLGVLGWLFKSQSKTDSKNELLIFITPRIVKLKQKNSMDI